MALIHLSVSAFPFSHSGVAGVNLMISVTDANGVPYTGLSDGDFTVHWIDNVNIDEEFAFRNFREYNGSGTLPELPGVYNIELMTRQGGWSQPSTFYIAVREFEKGDHGQTLYRVNDGAIVGH